MHGSDRIIRRRCHRQADNGKGYGVDRVVARKTVGGRILMDGLGMMTQLGVIPAEKAASENAYCGICYGNRGNRQQNRRKCLRIKH